MARLEKYKELFRTHQDNLHNGYTVEQALDVVREFIKIHDGTLDSIAAKTFLARFLMSQGEYGEFEPLLRSLDLTGNKLVDFFILMEKSLKNLGIHEPTIDLDKSEELYKQAQILAKKIDF